MLTREARVRAAEAENAARRQAIVELLKTRYASFNSRSDACKLSGFLPLHAIVANGKLQMYDFVTKELPHEQRADGEQVTRLGKVAHVRSLTSLQLSASMGDHRMFRHIMSCRSSILWRWGDVTAYQVLVGA